MNGDNSPTPTPASTTSSFEHVESNPAFSSRLDQLNQLRQEVASLHAEAGAEPEDEGWITAWIDAVNKRREKQKSFADSMRLTFRDVHARAHAEPTASADALLDRQAAISYSG